MEQQNKVKLAIVDDHNLFRKGLIKLIHLGDTDNKYTVIFEAENGYDLKDKLNPRNLPDIILMDIDMPDMDGFQAVEWLRKCYPSVSVLVISMFESEEVIIKMLRFGINGYLSKDIEVEDMHLALETISKKGYYYSEFVSGVMAHTILKDGCAGSTGTANELWENISANEKEFLKLACTELTYQEIANKMNLSPKTIDGYREKLFERFKVKNRVGLAMYAVKNSFIKI
jgi:DNA-binding NarL/FixJ family response regulator